MKLPRLRMDFNSNSLGNQWTQADIKRQMIELCEGMRCIFYELDEQNGQRGFLHSDGVVWWDAESSVFRIDMRTVEFRFTPGDELGILDDEYPEIVG